MLNLADYKFKTKAYWGVLVTISVALVCFSAYQSIFFSVSDWLILAFTTIVCLILSQYDFKIPYTKERISTNDFAILWAMIWLGTSGTILLAVLGVAGNFRSEQKDRVRWTMKMSALSVTAFISSSIFYFVLARGFGFKEVPVAGNPINAFGLLGALIAGSCIYFLIYSSLSDIFIKLQNDIDSKPTWKERAIWIAVSSALCVTVVFVFHLINVLFGLSFGLAAVPLAIVAHLSYRFHRRTLAQKTREMSEASRVHGITVEVLATAIDARDQVGRGHVARTQIYAVGIGKALDLPSDEMNALTTGALLHDIGKLAVPDHILNKPGRLTPAEMEKMKIHPEVGASILEKVDFPYPVVPTVRYHHEAWDGSGYPEGLSKDEIPLTARILTIADAYDSIRGSRPYSRSVAQDEARKHILIGAGSQFDPELVDIFIRNLNRFEKEAEKQELAYRPDEDEIHSPNNKNESVSYVEQIKKANREVYTLYELARVFSSSLNLEETLSLFATKIGELVPLDTCIVYLLNEDQSVAVATHTEGKNSDTLKNRKIKVGQGATGYAMKKRQPIYNINPGLDFSFYQMEFIQEYTSMASLPLIANEKLIGAVSLYSCDLETYEDEHMRLLETLSRIASDAISTALRHAESKTQALTDSLTTLPNARSLQIQFDKEIARARRNNSNFQILMIDLDGFKAINDTFGHKVGDRLLKDISAIMGKQLRDYDFIARYAGDEFVVIVPETNDSAVRDLCLRMEKAVSEYKLDVGDGKFANVGVSLGAAAYPRNGETLDQIIIAADKAMYEVKGQRKAILRQQLEARTPLKVKDDQPVPIDEVEVQNIDVEPIEAMEVIDIEKESLIVELDESHVVVPKKPSKKKRPT